MNELHLFAGTGGGILGGMLLGHTTICAVEIEPYARKVLLQRQRDGILPKFPIWDDIRTFDAKPWRGKVDIVCGGFPCQDISCANTNAKGIDGERSGLWREMARVVSEVRPRFVFVENSPMLALRGLDRVLGDFTKMGYDAQWCVMGADDVGAPHKRKRMWILAHSRHECWGDCIGRGFEQNGNGRLQSTELWNDSIETSRPSAKSKTMADSTKFGLEETRSQFVSKGTGRSCALSDTELQWYGWWQQFTQGEQSEGNLSAVVYDTESDRHGLCRETRAILEANGRQNRELFSEFINADCVQGKDLSNATGTGFEGVHCRPGEIEVRGRNSRAIPLWWRFDPADIDGAFESQLGRVADGVANRVDRLKAIGNGQVPLVAARAFQFLMQKAMEV